MNELRRIGAVGDVHCEDEHLALALDHLQGLEVGAILCVGDLVDGRGDVNRACQLLQERDVRCVAGNHERWLLAGQMRSLDDATPPTVLSDDNRRWLQSLPRVRHLSTVAGPLLLCHGVAKDDMAVLKPDTRGYALQSIDALRALMSDQRVHFMLGGHTHERMVRQFQGLTVINPGTLRRGDEPGFALVDFEAMEVRFFDLEGSAVREASVVALPPPAPLP